MHHWADVKLSFPCLLPGAALGILPAISGWFVCLFWVSICCFKNWELVILSRRSVGYASWTADPKPRKAWDGFYKWYPAGFTCTSEACQLLLLRAALTTAHPGASSFTRCREEWGERCSSLLLTPLFIFAFYCCYFRFGVKVPWKAMWELSEV